MRPSRNSFSRSTRFATVGLLALAALLMAPSSCGNGWTIEIVSSALHQVSDGDALVRVGFPQGVLKPQAVLLLNGEDVTDSLTPDGGDLVGVIEGFTVGSNLLELKPAPKASAVKAVLLATNHPKSGPIFSGPHQQPFVCTTARAALGQPSVDNQDEIGIPVAVEDEGGNYPSDGRGYPTAGAEIVGWSKNCAGERRLDYLYRSTGGQFLPLDSPGGPLPGDIAMTTTLDGHTVPYIVRWERGRTQSTYIGWIQGVVATSQE